MTARARVRAPELAGKGGWLNTGGKALGLADLRGSIVILDFWTFCCVNCLHVLDELRELEERHRDTVVIVGVHSPKFVHEAEHGAVVDAVERYGVGHPVLDDPDLATWKQYAVRAWPTLVVIDPEGYVVAQHAGEGHAHALETLVTALEAEHAAKGTLRRGDGPYVPPEPVATDLRFPGKVLALPGSGHFLVSDSTRHALVELAADGERALRRIGTGERGLADGDADTARFSEPQGLALLPRLAAAGGPPTAGGDVAAPAPAAPAHGYAADPAAPGDPADVPAPADPADVVVADTVNHVLRRVDLATGRVTTLAGTGRQWMPGSPTSGPAREVALSSPWDVAWFDGRLWIAMAGVHQLWTYDPATDRVEAVAGTTNEGLVDGPAADAWFAQPSGLAAGDGRLWVADSETSALRWLERAPGEDAPEGVAPDDGSQDGDGGTERHYVVRTAVGTGLFDFGHRDGPAGQALLQHPLGVTVLPDGSVAVSDTYNDALRRYDPVSGEVSTLATGLREPSAAAVTGGDIVVVESAAHRLTRMHLPEEAVRVESVAHRTRRAATEVAAGPLRLEVVFSAPAGQKLDQRYGPSTRLLVGATPPELLREGAGSGTDLFRELVLDPDVPEGVLHVSATAASCDDDPANPYPACHVHQQDWGVPVRLTPDGAARLGLVLAGMDEAATPGDDPGVASVDATSDAAPSTTQDAAPDSR